MNFETPKIENTKEDKTLDDKWYDRFKEVGSFQDYEYLVGDKEYREEQKQKFLSGEIENPTLDYPELKKLKFEEIESKLLELKKDILENEKNEIVRQLYRWRINEKIAETRMLKAVRDENDKKFSRYSNFIYGKPNKEIYEYTISQIKKVIDEKLLDPDINTRDLALKLNHELFDLLRDNENIINPERYNLPKFKSSKEDTEFLSEDIKTAFEKALEEYQITEWKVVVDKEGKFTGINVSQELKQINIPQNRKLRQSNLVALIKHEIGTHVARREHGEKTKLKLLGLGLDRYLKGEEGMATFQEQGVLGAKDFSGLDGHLAICLASGIDGKKRNFREVFEILKKFYFLNSKKGKLEAIRNAEDNAWNRCARTFRGTTCKITGICFTRDIVYREGNIGIWNMIKNNPEEIRRFSVGKYDPANPRHIWILDQLGITEKDLQEIEREK